MAKLIKTINDFKKSLNGKTVTIHGREYATVALRLAILRRNFGASADVVTKIIFHDKEQVTMQADIYIEGKHVATGTAHELKAGSRINTTSYVENCETSAVGRALAMCGLINDSVASADEVSLAISLQNKKLQTALKTLETIDHEGGYKSWLADNQVTFKQLKENDPLGYQSFLEKFTSTKNNLLKKGIINNGR